MEITYQTVKKSAWKITTVVMSILVISCFVQSTKMNKRVKDLEKKPQFNADKVEELEEETEKNTGKLEILRESHESLSELVFRQNDLIESIIDTITK